MLGLCKADTLARSLQPSKERALSADEATALASVYEVNDTIVLPDYRRRGVATVLWQEAVRELKPDIIVGQTNNPDQVLARSSALVGLDFRTFYGTVETTPTGSQEQTSEHEQIRQAVIAYLGGVSDERSVWTHELFGCFLKPTLPDLSSYPRHIQTAFAPVSTAQDQAGDRKVAISSLISVSRKFLV
jgi:GNAT superfamily N-acetyltransferase